MMIHHYATCEFRPGGGVVMRVTDPLDGGCEIDDVDDFDPEDAT